VAVLEKDKMLDIVENVVKIAQKNQASEVEAYAYEGQTTNVGIDRGQINKSNRIIDRGLGVRISINKTMGFAYTNILDSRKAIEDTVLSSLSAAKASKPDKEWNGFPEKKSYSPTEETFDRKVLDLRAEDLVEKASNMLDAAVAVNKRVFPVEGGAGAACISNAIANSNGISAFEKGTIVECSLAAVAKEKTKVTPVCFEFNAERTCNVDPFWVGKEAARLAISALNTKRIKTKNTKLIFTPFALQELLYFTLINALKADNVQRNQSPFKDRLGELVASEDVTISDEGLFPSGLRTWMFDGEGTPQQRTALIDKGILRGFLYDNYTAKKEGIESTGNASRAGYLSTPSIEATNFHIYPGNLTQDELLSEMRDGLLIYYLQGSHSSNPVSGEFSVVATPAWKVEKGEVSYSTRGVMLAGNIFEVLKTVNKVANNERKIGMLIAPWIQVDNVRVIGK
jgi:PmbA protein